MLKKLLACCLVLVLTLPGMLSCSGAKTSEIKLVPAAANTIIQIQVGKILSNSAIQIAYDELAKTKPAWPQTVNDVLSQLVQKTGIDLSTISSVVLFADIESTGQTQESYSGIIVAGKFKESELIAKIQQQIKQDFTTSDYKGLTVYSAPKDQYEIVFLSQSQLALGSVKAVQDVVDVSKGNQPAVSGTIIDTLNRFGSALIVGASILPENLRNQLVGKVPQQTTLSMKSLRDMDIIGFAIDQPSLNLSFRIDAHFTVAASAKDAQDTISGLISVAKGTSQDANVKTALGNIQISTNNSWLSIRDLISPTDVMNLVSTTQTQK
jgi:hypothetical protein